jgi:Cu/Ag efflux pump CusA
MGIRHVLPVSTPEELAQVTVQGKKNMVLGDISTVVENHQPLIGDAIINGKEGLLLVIEKFPWASTVKVSEAVEDALDKLAPGLAGVAIDTEIYQPETFIEASGNNVSTGIIISIVVIILLFFLLFYEWRAALTSIVAILCSMLAGAYILYLRGVIFDMMVIAGFIVALGVIIDDAICVVDNIRRRLSEKHTNGTDESTAVVVLNAVLEMRRHIAFATGILLLVAVPFFFIGGIAGSFLQPLVRSYLLALIASSLTALIITPAMCMWLYARTTNGFQESPILIALRNKLGTGVSRIIQKPKVVYIILGIVAVIGIGLIPMVDIGPRLPIPQERDIVITWEADYGTSHPEMVKVTQDVISKLRTVPGINNAAAHIGRAVLSDKINNIHSGEIWLSIDDDVDYTSTLAAIEKVVKEYPEMKSEVMTYGQQSLRKSLTGIGKEYAIRVYGENQAILTRLSENVKNAITDVGGLSDATIEYPSMEPVIEIEVDLEKAKQYNIKPGDVRRTAATLLAGIEVGSIFEEQKIFDVVVWGVPEVRSSIESVKNLLVNIPGSNRTVRIGDVAKVQEIPNPAIIKREKISRYMDVSFIFSGSDLTALDDEVNSTLQNVEFPLEYHAELVGEFEEFQVAEKRLRSIIIAALIGIFLLLQAAFWSWRKAMIAFLVILLGLSGCMIGIMLSGGDISLGSLVGFLCVLGIAAHNCVSLIKSFKTLEMKEGIEFGPFLVIRGLQDRLGPIFMTSIITVLAFLPFVALGNVPGLEIIHPMSIVVIGGVITTLVLNIFVLPGLYVMYGKASETMIEEEKAMLELDVEQPISA